MSTFDSIYETFSGMGVSSDNIEYAIQSAKDGAKREHILENLKADYRGMEPMHANMLVEAVFRANGGEFKKENRGGYLFGAFFLMLGLPLAYYLYTFYTDGGVLVRPILIWAGAIVFNLAGIFLILKSLLGKYRNSDQPFSD